jgi:hypothetical protein
MKALAVIAALTAVVYALTRRLPTNTPPRNRYRGYLRE